MRGSYKIIKAILLIMFMYLLSFDLILFSFKKVNDNFIKKDTISTVIDTLNITDLIKDKNGNESDAYKAIKSKIVDSGVPEEIINEFLNSDVFHEYLTDVVKQSMNKIINDDKNVMYPSMSTFLEKRIDDISNELQTKEIKGSEKLNKELQKEIIKNMESISPIIDQKVQELTDSLNGKLDENKVYLRLINNGVSLLLNEVFTVVLVVLFIAFTSGLVLTRQRARYSIKYIGITFIVTSLVAKVMSITTNSIASKSGVTIISNYLSEFSKVFSSDSLFMLIDGLVFIIISVSVYFTLKYTKKHEKTREKFNFER